MHFRSNAGAGQHLPARYRRRSPRAYGGRVTTRLRRRRLAAVALVGLVLGGCSGDSGRDEADAPASSEETTSTAAAGEGGMPTSTLPPAGGPIDLGALAASVAPGAGSSTVPGSPAPAGSEGGGTAGTTPAAADAGTGGSGGGGTTGTTTAPDAAPATGTGSGSNTVDETPAAGGSDSPLPSIAATAQECAALNQLLAVVDHPDLRQLKAQTGC